jgi:site-specific DNA-methyltransferase (adenine-specific)
MNKIFNEDCLITMNRKELKNKVDLVITSPPYNMTKRKGGYADKCKRYDVYEDWKSEEDYIDFIVDVFNGYDLVLKENGCVAFNFSYSKENPSLPYKMVNEICRKTNLEIVDTIVWKKKTAIPHPASKNRLRRVCEFIYIFAKKENVLTFDTNKNYNVGVNGQKYYEIVDNFIEAKNNDGSNDLNKATFSTDLVDSILKTYAKPNSLVYDSFIGIGTTAKSCIKNEINYIGSEISKKQIDYFNGSN